MYIYSMNYFRIVSKQPLMMGQCFLLYHLSVLLETFILYVNDSSSIWDSICKEPLFLRNNLPYGNASFSPQLY